MKNIGWCPTVEVTQIQFPLWWTVAEGEQDFPFMLPEYHMVVSNKKMIGLDFQESHSSISWLQNTSTHSVELEKKNVELLSVLSVLLRLEVIRKEAWVSFPFLCL